jgi:hypothetical protein
MDYGEILSRAWKIIWKHKILWLFGILAGCVNSSGGSYSGSPPSSGQPGDNGIHIAPPPEVQRILDNITGEQIAIFLAAFFLVIVLFSIIAIFITTIGRIALVRGAWQADRDVNARLNFGELFSGSLHYFWRVFLLGLLVGLGMLAFGFVAFLIFVGGVIITLGLGLCLLPLLCLLAPLAWVVNVLQQQATIAMVVEDLGVFDGLRRAWQVMRSNPGPLIVMWLILTLGVSGIGGLIIGLPLLLALTPLFLGIFFGDQQALRNMLVIALLCCTAYFPVLLILGGALRSYVDTAWTLTFLQLTNPAPIFPEASSAPITALE